MINSKDDLVDSDSGFYITWMFSVSLLWQQTKPMATWKGVILQTKVMLWETAGRSTSASLSSTFKSACCLTLVSSSVLSAFVKILVKHLVSRVLFACALTAPQALGADTRLWCLHDELGG